MTLDRAEQDAERELLGELIESDDMVRIEAVIASAPPVEIARMISSISKPDQIRLLEMLGAEESAHLISKIADLGTGNLVTQLPTPQAVSIVKEKSRDQQAHFLRTIDDDDAEAILDEIKPHNANTVRKLMSYTENTAGALVPLILRDMRTDPALASGPLLTTVTDMCGFFFVLSFASLMLPRLAG